jgi:hypothetical protein
MVKNLLPCSSFPSRPLIRSTSIPAPRFTPDGPSIRGHDHCDNPIPRIFTREKDRETPRIAFPWKPEVGLHQRRWSQVRRLRLTGSRTHQKYLHICEVQRGRSEVAAQSDWCIPVFKAERLLGRKKAIKTLAPP